MTTTLAPLWRPLHSTALFVRFPLVWFTMLVPLLGAATVEPNLPGETIAGLVAVALCYHIFSYVLNDVVDLPVDRTAPQRQEDPLVRGSIGRGQALAIALGMVPLALAFTTALGGGGDSFLTLSTAFVLMAIYDLWGKRLRLPPLTDLVQGIGWGALCLYGATIVDGPPTPLTFALAAFFALYVYMINGVQASLRDIGNDLACRMRTTAILLGVRPRGERLEIPQRFRLYALLLQATLTALLGVPLALNWFDYAVLEWVVAAAAFLILNGVTWLCLARANSSVIKWERVYNLSLAHIGAWQSAQVLLFLPGLRGTPLLVVLVAHVGVFLSSDWALGQVESWWKRAWS